MFFFVTKSRYLIKKIGIHFTTPRSRGVEKIRQTVNPTGPRQFELTKFEMVKNVIDGLPNRLL